MSDFSKSARQQIRRAIRDLQSNRFDTLRRSTEDEPGPVLEVLLGRATATYITGTIGTFSLLLCPGNKGAETESSETVTAYVRFGTCFIGQDYFLIETAVSDDAIFEVLNPDASATVLGVPTALTQYGNLATLTIYSGSPGAEASTGQTISAYVRKGLVFAGKMYRAVWVDNDWDVIDPSLTVRGKPTGDVAAAASGTLSIYTGTFGSESQPSGNPQVSNVRNDSSCTVLGSVIATAEWVDDNSGWQFVVGKT